MAVGAPGSRVVLPVVGVVPVVVGGSRVVCRDPGGRRQLTSRARRRRPGDSPALLCRGLAPVRSHPTRVE